MPCYQVPIRERCSPAEVRRVGSSPGSATNSRRPRRAPVLRIVASAIIARFRIPGSSERSRSRSSSASTEGVIALPEHNYSLQPAFGRRSGHCCRRKIINGSPPGEAAVPFIIQFLHHQIHIRHRIIPKKFREQYSLPENRKDRFLTSQEKHPLTKSGSYPCHNDFPERNGLVH